MHSSNTTRNIVIISVVGSILFAAAIGGFIFWYEGNEKDAAREASDKFATALVEKKPSAAPDGASDYVKGARKYFGPIKAAKTVDVRQVDNYSQTSNSANDRSWWTSTIFMRTERGAALLLVTFADSFDPKDAKVEAIRELSPRKVGDGALDATESRDAKRGFASRGGKAAPDLVLEGTFTMEQIERAKREAPSEEEIEQQRDEGQRKLKCLQDAHQDIDKIKKC